MSPNPRRGGEQTPHQITMPLAAAMGGCSSCRAGGQLPPRAVDLARRVLAKLAFREMGKCVFAEECLARRLVGCQTELVVHAEARHHVAYNVGRLVQIVGRSRGMPH